jgi:hypothetical protein
MTMLIVKNVERICRMEVTELYISDKQDKVLTSVNVILVSFKAYTVRFVIADQLINYLLKP